jgi:hypothetical protein
MALAYFARKHLMAHREDVPIQLDVKVTGLEKIVGRMETSLSTIKRVHRVLIKHARMTQQRAVWNVSGNPVTFQGKTFIVNRQTGKLARSIQVVDTRPLSAAVEASAEYASDVELGTRGPTDLKQTKLAGKVVPLRLSKRIGQAVAAFGGAKAVQKKATTGRVMGTEYIAFRRVGKTGWIIPQRAGRPFMAEAGDWIAPQLTQAVEKEFAAFLDEGDLG